MKTACYTYFRIAGNFDPDTVTALLGIQPDSVHRIGELRKNGTSFDFAEWTCGRCSDYSPIISEMMMQTLRPLMKKAAVLRQLRAQYDIMMTLETVPTLCPSESPPCLAPSMEVMQFCTETGTELDIDLYFTEA